MKITACESRDGKIVLQLEKDEGSDAEIELNSMDAMALLSLIRTVLQDAVNDPSAGSYGHADVHHLQFRTMPNGDQFFCIYLNQAIFHEYAVPANTTLATDLKDLADRVALRQEARAIIQPSGSSQKN